jgi:hypothetical protein
MALIERHRFSGNAYDDAVEQLIALPERVAAVLRVLY